VPSEAKALGIISNMAGALGVVALMAFFARVDEAWPGRWSVMAAVAAATCPLYWFTAARPLSDVPGLAAAVGVQALLVGAAGDWAIIAASALAALATGIRSQAAWLTVPLLVWAVVRHRPSNRPRFILGAAAAFSAGVAAWAVPLVAITGGPVAYWRALFAQGAADLTGIEMLSTTPTPRVLLRALYFALVAPWSNWQLATCVLIFAFGGALTLYRSARSSLLLLALAFGPYLLFDLLFQETFTSRYALPIVVPIAYLAMRTVSAFPPPGGMIVALAGAAFAAIVAGVSVFSYSMMEAPAFRLLGDMRATAAVRRKPSIAPVLAMHRREDLDFRRPIEWLGAGMPSFSRRLEAPPKHEWLELVKYWNAGGREPVWFVADPQRTDLALIDHGARPFGAHGTYRWPLLHPELLGGVRPNEMDWYVFDAPGWYLGEGWSLTPETAGVAQEDHRGPGASPIEGWIRRRPDAVTLMVGGRNLDGSARPADVDVSIDGKRIQRLSVPPGFFLRFLRLQEGALAGEDEYARLSIATDTVSDGQPRTVIEQFDAQSVGRVVFGFGDGWHEMEYNSATGRPWRWMSDRGVIRVFSGGRPLKLTIAGETEGFTGPTRVTARIGERVIGQWVVGSRFTVQTQIPAAATADGETAIGIESDQFFVPAERSRRSRDRRRLALRVTAVQLTPVF
jgi:hypothetical protein